MSDDDSRERLRRKSRDLRKRLAAIDEATGTGSDAWRDAERKRELRASAKQIYIPPVQRTEAAVMNKPVFEIPPYIVHRTFTAQQAGEQIPWHVRDYGINKGWQRTRGKGIRIGIVDTGVDEQHMKSGDLAGAVVAAKDFTRSRIGYYDKEGHGTHVAGIIGAREGNGVGIAGIIPDCELVIAKGLGDDGSGSDQSVSAAVLYCVEQRCNSINLSLGSLYPSEQIYRACLAAIEQGIPVIAAAGNSGGGRPLAMRMAFDSLDDAAKEQFSSDARSRAGAPCQDLAVRLSWESLTLDERTEWVRTAARSTVGYPARHPEVIAVGAVDRNRMPTDFSDWGPEVDIAAPGQAIFSLFRDGGFATLSGTSMACPHVTACVGMIQSAAIQDGGDGKMTPAGLRGIMLSAADDIGPPGKDTATGHGLLANPDRWLPVEDGGPDVPAVGTLPIPFTDLALCVPSRSGGLFSLHKRAKAASEKAA